MLKRTPQRQMDAGATVAPGKVWLVGAGPGDPELITLKAVRLLGQADVVLVDDLVNPALLGHCPQARVVRVGKRGGCRSTPQAFIQRLMWRYARQGMKVMRLKGGDPGVFGRSGEESQWLGERGVTCEVVNGITAGMAAAAVCALPLTMRGMTQGVTLVTGHTEQGEPPCWTALVQGGTTLVIYMGVATLAGTQAALMRAGMAPDTRWWRVAAGVITDTGRCARRVTCSAMGVLG